VSVRRYDHRHEEALQCARWVRSIYRPGSTLGIVVPELEDYRTLLDHELTAELAPGKIYPWVEEGKPFNISLGTPLAHEPMVRLALTFLGHSSTVIPLSTFAEILTSPFFTCGRDVLEEARALDRELRDKRASRIDLDHPPAVMQTGQAPEIITLASTWSAHLQNGRSLRPRQWAEVFNETLTRAGWPAAGEPRSARARQALAAWYKNLEILASLDRVLGRISRREAAATLERIALAPEFQVKTPEQPIQVVGLLESAGMRFDHLWVMGCHADVFPGSPSPNPFIPIALRKQYRLPRASASRELEFAENSLRRLLATAPDVVLSYPEWEGNTQLQMSPLLDLWRKEDSNIKIHQSHREKDRCGKPGLELLRESLLLPVAGSEAARFAATLPGGTSVLKDIAACPFRAFAVHRLGVKVVELPEIDFDHPERGSLVHRALEFFWRGVKSKTRLMELESRHRLEEALAQAVTDALGDLARQGRFFDIERERVTRLLLDWMRDIEMKRADFEVTGEEKDVTLDIGGLKLKMRVDRIDRAAGGKVLVIDYKTGEAKPSGWFGERIQEPQLPLYAVKLAPDAVVFAQVLKGKMRLHAAGDPRPPADPGYVNIEKISGCAGWPELLKQWRQNLEAAAGRFLAGDTQVDPHHENICGYCGMESLCRIEALTEDEHGEEDDA
jgi:probable DNA repair protein